MFYETSSIFGGFCTIGTVERLVAAFQRESEATVKMQSSGRPPSMLADVSRSLSAQCMEEDNR